MTTPEHYRRVRNLFDATVERPPDEAAAFLEEACQGDPELLAEVRQLLDARARPQTWIDRPALGLKDRMEGRRVGPYQILREIASGGMGTVYLARRADGAFEKRVALKVLRPETASPEVLRRFQQERDILAALDHPNIARILDGGRTEDGLPYLAMEFIDGQPIDRHCQERRLDVADRLRLFRAVCGAVRYAHQHGVVHRDLKPSNILVTTGGVPKLLDFGISKVLASAPEDFTACMTRTGLWLMTPEYASPEQVRGEPAGAPTDVYSLGVVLYELLTGQRPYRLRSRLFHEVVRVICEEPPTRPSAAASMEWDRRRLSGDLDAVVLKTLEKLPGRRYRSVEALDSEIERHLAGRSVEARRPRAIELAQRVVRGNSGWIMTALVIGTLLFSGVVQVQKQFIPVLAPLGLALVGALLAQSHELGGEVARRLFGRVSGVMVACAILGVLTVFAVPKEARPNFFAVLNVFVVSTLAYLLARWPLRGRWAGRLLLDIGRPRPRWIYAPVLLMIAGATMVVIDRGFAANLQLRDFSGVAQSVALGASMFVLYPKSEIRERGIVLMGQLLPWRRLEAHWWDDARGKAAILRFSWSGWRRILPSVALIVPLELKEEADTVVQRYMQEWPGR